MGVEDELKKIIIDHYGSVNKFAAICDVPYSTIATIFVRGINKANISTVIAICKELKISADELANGKITPYQYIEPNMEYINLDDLNEENQKRLKDYYELLKRSQNG
jgi:hypothetical protein